jgi:SAM-dependent methyltransferase
MKLNTLPFHIGATDQAINPGGLPNTYPFELVFDSYRGMLVQQTYRELEQVLQDAYAVGQSFGTPLAEDKFGKPYAEDFLSFIQEAQAVPQRGLEIGAGVGYLTRRLLDLGWDMTSLEPGQGYEPFWLTYGVNVIQEFFPSSLAPGPYQLVCSYGVLEHVPDPLTFLKAIKYHLTPGGKAVISVPDCTDEIRAGDPSILFHEHFNYFDAGSLTRLIELAGMSGSVVKSRFGRCLYAVVGMESVDGADGESGLDLELVASYPQRCQNFVRRVRDRLSCMASTGTLGVYCAARGLPLLDPMQAMRFFDDDPAQQGKFLPPFPVPIAGRDDLFTKPVDHLVIMSRTFGERIRDSLCQQGYRGSIVTLDEM